MPPAAKTKACCKAWVEGETATDPSIFSKPRVGKVVVSGSVCCEETNSFYVYILFFSCFLTPTFSRPSPLWPARCYLQKLTISLGLFICFVSTCLSNMLQLFLRGQGGKKHFQAARICLSSLSQDLLFENGELKGEVACWIQNDPHVTHSRSAKHISASNSLKTNLQGLSVLLHKERWPRQLWFHSFLGLNQAESQKQNACR